MSGALTTRRSTLQVALVGDRGSGKTTFLGLLYAAQVKSGSDRKDDFRFHATYESLDQIALVFQGLMAGSFPDSATKEGIHEIGFQLGYRKPKAGIFPRFRAREWDPSDFATLRFKIVRVFDPEMARLLSGGTAIDGKSRDLLDADVLVVFVDSTKLAAKGEEPLTAYDGAVDSVLTAVQRWRDRGGRPTVYPIFALSKFDCVRPEAVRSANLEATPPPAGKRGPRANYADALLKRSLPRTLARVKAPHRKGMQFAAPTYLFPWVRTEPAAAGKAERIRLRRMEGGGWEPDYSRGEYLAFLDCLRDIAARVSG